MLNKHELYALIRLAEPRRACQRLIQSMSASANAGGAFSDDPSAEKALMMAQHEMEFRVELFNR